MKPLFIILILAVFSLTATACQNSAAIQFDGDQQPDGDADADTLSDGDAGSEVDAEADLDSPDGDLDLPDGDQILQDGDADASELDLDTEPDRELMEPDRDYVEIDRDLVEEDRDAAEAVEADEETPEPGIRLIVEKLPFPTTTVVPCSEKLTNSYINGIWGDNLGLIFFAGRSLPAYRPGVAPFWVYDTATDTFTCDASVTEDLTSISGRVVDGQPEVWVSTKTAIGRLAQGAWTWIEIPESIGITDSGNKILRITVNESGIVAVWSDLGTVFYNSVTQTWSPLVLCTTQNTPTIVTGGNWLGDTYYLADGCSIFAIDPAAPDCQSVRAVEECLPEHPENPDARAFMFPLGVAEGELWFYNLKSSGDGSPSFSQGLAVDVRGDGSVRHVGADLSVCYDRWSAETSLPTSGFGQFINPVMAGVPVLYQVISLQSGTLGCQTNSFINLSTSVDQADCDPFEEIASRYYPEVPCFIGVGNSFAWRSSGSEAWAFGNQSRDISRIRWVIRESTP
jgi:hypothetical protein